MKGIEFLFKKNKVETIQGYGRLAGPGRITVTDAEGQTREIQAQKIVLATGSEAKTFPGFEPDGKTILTNKEVLALKAIPKLDGDYGCGGRGRGVCFDFSALRHESYDSRDVPRAVPLEDEEISAELEKSFRRQGIASRRRPKVERATKTSKGITVSYSGADGKAQAIEAETLLVAVGRRPILRMWAWRRRA